MSTPLRTDPVAWDTVELALHDQIMASSGFPADHVIWSQQGGKRPTDPWISLNMLSVTEAGLDWTDYEDNPIIFTALTVSGISGNNLTVTGHGLQTGDGPVIFTTTGVLPGGLVAGTHYWVIVVDADHIQVASSYTNSIFPWDNSAPIPITLTGASGSGSNNLTAITGKTFRKGQELVARTRAQWVATLSIQCYSMSASGVSSATATLAKVMLKFRTNPVIRALNAAGIGVSDFTPVKSVGGVISMTIFEPRATMTMKFFLAAQIEDYETYIARVTGTLQAEDETDTVVRTVPFDVTLPDS